MDSGDFIGVNFFFLIISFKFKFFGIVILLVFFLFDFCGVDVIKELSFVLCLFEGLDIVFILDSEIIEMLVLFEIIEMLVLFGLVIIEILLFIEFRFFRLFCLEDVIFD